MYNVNLTYGTQNHLVNNVLINYVYNICKLSFYVTS